MTSVDHTGATHPQRGKVEGGTAAHSWAADIGPGVITMAADNDPAGIVTYSLAGAQFGYDMLWTCVLSYPSIVALQLVSARIAVLTGNGLTTNMRKHYSRVWFLLAVGRFLIANTFNIAADVVAMGVGAHLLWGGSIPGLATFFLILSVALQWFVPYAKYARVLKWLALSLFAYVGVDIALQLEWTRLTASFFVPHISWSGHYLEMLLAVLGTTISPYLLYSQAAQQVETQRPQDARSNDESRREAGLRRLRSIRGDTLIRTGLSNAIAVSMMIAAAATLRANGRAPDSAASLASVLAPVAGRFDTHLFGLALISSALLALPPLAGSAAHAVASTVGWPLDHQHNRRIAFALIAIVSLGGAMGIVLAAMQLDPIRVLYWSAVVNGTTATPVMVLLVLLSTRHSCVGDLSAHWTLRALSWLATAAMGAAVVARYACRLLG
ncbi:Nramp family divalent metal transporter [Paraburkholderia fynbosensis]|uniref:Divalent metal cation transporter MntH n=1 Tax=Paraburkholderia fynbosensis TaxID=1200993 RepID=A0A6J5GR93_9BURK|nr:Nramp family divalent metal transporter [Paraburkholderia fynbosensis]CAB3803162.1 Divalent metal cation transporter MntH [Paraburkholderia fynbosensis]